MRRCTFISEQKWKLQCQSQDANKTKARKYVQRLNRTCWNICNWRNKFMSIGWRHLWEADAIPTLSDIKNCICAIRGKPIPNKMTSALFLFLCLALPCIFAKSPPTVNFFQKLDRDICSSYEDVCQQRKGLCRWVEYVRGSSKDCSIVLSLNSLNVFDFSKAIIGKLLACPLTP